MSRYIQIQFTRIMEMQSDMLVALLSEAGFEGFEQQENMLNAFIGESEYTEDAVNRIAQQFELKYTKSIIEETNWNELWESNFDPVIVDDFAAIRAHFHVPVQHVEHEIVITPKMSFGTGHHATTCLMIREMRQLDIRGKTVFDFGTGTGVLAILAEKAGAVKVHAIDNDRWSFENASENIERNHCEKIELHLGNAPLRGKNFDVILANINKNVIVENIEVLSQQIRPGGCIVLSGLLREDRNDVLTVSGRYGLRLLKEEMEGNWLLLKLAP